MFGRIALNLHHILIFMLNWRTVVGFILLAGGIVGLYTIIGNHVKSNPLAAEVGCVVWMAAGVFLMVKGMNNNKTS